MEPETNKLHKVLLVDDDEDDFLIVERLLSKNTHAPFELQWAPGFIEGRVLIEQKCHDLYLIDYRLGARSGLDLLEATAALKRPEPFIVLTGASDQEVERQAMKWGAADYLVKGTFTAELLARSLLYALQRKRIEEQRLQHLIDVNRAKDEFISLASHQLRTPATGVKQYVGMLLQGFAGDITGMQHDMLIKAYESNERQLQIVSDLLRVARVDAGRVRLVVKPVDLGRLIDDVLKEQQNTFIERQQRVDFKRPAKVLWAAADIGHLRMVLENIIDNASKYSPDGKVITITIHQDARQYRVAIKDRGVGISRKDHQKLFQKFSRIDNPLSTLVGGTGLGLYWAKRIVDLHGGDIEVASSRGRGTTFTICLPKTKP